MTITPTMLYWILMLDNIRTVLGVCMGLSVFFIVVSFVILVNVDTRKSNICGVISLIVSALLLITFISGRAFTPSTKQMATIIVAPKLINSNFVQKDLPKEAKELYGMAKSYLKEQVTPNKESK